MCLTRVKTTVLLSIMNSSISIMNLKLTISGPSIEWIHKLYDIWTNQYSWSTAAKEVFAWQHFTTELEGLNVHFVHERACRSSEHAIPLLLVHGWPGSFYEFHRVISPLIDPKEDGVPSFDVIVPSLPGFCWSSGPPRGWTLQDTARIYDQLMKRLSTLR